MFKKVLLLWKKGKEDNLALETTLIPFKSYILNTLLSYLIVVIIAIPLVIIVTQTISIYGYLFLANRVLLYIGLAMLCIFFVIVNAYVSLLTLRLLKIKFSEIDLLTNINDKSFFVYHLLNPGFIIFIFAIAFIFGGFI